MAGHCPSLSGAFAILSAAGEQKLLHLKHKLKSLRPGCPRAELLFSMVLLQLGRETEARISLEALKADAVAQWVASHWAGTDRAPAPAETPDLSWAVAQLYHLLAEEKLCPGAMRDSAYLAALRTLSSSADPRLGELQKEARERCGWGLAANAETFQSLHSDLGRLPPSSASSLSRTLSLPQPIEVPPGWSHGHSLKSTGSPISLASKLEISQSPTKTFLSLHRDSPGPSKLCAEPGLAPRGCQVPEEMSWPPPSEPASSPELAPQLPEDAPAASIHSLPDPPEEACANSQPYPVQCTETPGPARSGPAGSGNGSPDGARESRASPDPDRKSSQAPSPDPDRKSRQAPRGGTAFSVGATSDPRNSSPLPPEAPSPIAVPSEPREPKFYNFVVLHTRADEQVAMRVRQRLEDLGVSDGATFCEDFQLPGRGELSCLQDALDHSAFTILLLTPNFNCRLSLHQLNQAVMGSLTREGWHDSTLPFLPLESSQDQLSPDTASLLQGLVWLEERSPVFDRKVTNTFKSQLLHQRRENWRKEQEIRALREQREQLQGEQRRAGAWAAEYSACLQSYAALCQQLEQLQVDLGKYMTPGPQGPRPVFPTCPGLRGPPLPPWPPGITAPAFAQAPTCQPPSTFPPASPQSPGVQPLIIQNAHMVQLGLNNHMWGQRGAQAPEDKMQEAE